MFAQYRALEVNTLFIAFILHWMLFFNLDTLYATKDGKRNDCTWFDFLMINLIEGLYNVLTMRLFPKERS